MSTGSAGHVFHSRATRHPSMKISSSWREAAFTVPGNTVVLSVSGWEDQTVRMAISINSESSLDV